MLIKERQWRKCPTCERNHELLNEEVYGCDTCKRAIDLNKHQQYLQVTRFMDHQSLTTHHHFCSWKCVLKWLPKNPLDSFFSLPYLTYDTPSGKKLTKEFFSLMKKQP